MAGSQRKAYGTVGDAITETYGYNIQGWLTEKTSEVFDMRLRYYDPQQSETQASYTGNITEWEWRHKGADADGSENTYAFDYDKLSRLTDTRRYMGTSAAPTNAFTERDISYDRNGNMLAMQRYQSDPLTPQDDMAFTDYDGNRLTTLVNNGDSYGYEYDANGNMTSDGLNALKLDYNFLNLTGAVSDMSGNVQATYGWLANGTKTGVKNTAGTSGYEYAGSLVYIYVNGELQLESASFDGGRIIVSEGSSGTVYTPNYYITDHLGSVRATVDGQSGTITSRNNYYPYGLKWNDPGALISDNRWLYNGKELQTTGLPDAVNFLDYGARMYRPRLGRWQNLDSLAEKYYSVSPYAYCLNNPLRFIDPNGMDVWEMDINGNIIKRTRNTPFDEFYMVIQDSGDQWTRLQDQDGKDIGITFKRGTVISQKNRSLSGGGSYDVYEVRGDDNGTALFEFMAHNITGSPTQVEIGQTITGVAGNKGIHYITTSHENRKESGIKNLYVTQLYNGYTIREINHSHPNDAFPSGLDNRKHDIGFSRMVTDTQKQNNLLVPAFHIYHVPTQQKIKFGPNSQRYNFR